MSQNPRKESNGKGNQSDINLLNISQGKKNFKSSPKYKKFMQKGIL